MRLWNQISIANRWRWSKSRIRADFTAYSYGRRRNFGAKISMAVSPLSSPCSSSLLASVPRGSSLESPLAPVLLRSVYRILISPLLGLGFRRTDADLKFLIDNLEEKMGENEKWEKVIDKRNDILSHYAKCCKPKDSPLTYLSVTIFENCSPEKLRDFYMDNDYRKQWDKMLIQHEQLQMDKNKGVEVGRTIKKFPLLTARQYVLAWRLWEGKDNTFYCFIKECEHPLAPRQKKYVRVSTFRSGWRIRKVPDTNACEIKMFHQEDASLNVEMANWLFLGAYGAMCARWAVHLTDMLQSALINQGLLLLLSR